MHLQNGHTEPDVLFSRFSVVTSMIERKRGETVYCQGDLADAVFRIRHGYAKLTVVSRQGKEAVVAVLMPGSFFGHACVSGHKFREATATAISDCLITKIEQAEMARALKDEAEFSRLFLSYIVSRNVQLEADLADQLCSPCEMRLARTLLRLAAVDGRAGSTPLLSAIDQQTLAGIVGTTQPRISVLLSRFKKQGFIDYEAGLRVNTGLTQIISRRHQAANCAKA
jgi:CRP/FNR family cyclic AMP-dependent transcriptional regulator